MGIAFDEPAVPAAPAAAARVRHRPPPELAATAGQGTAARGAGRPRSLLLACLVGALAGLQLVLAVDRLSVVYVVDLSDSVGTSGREEALAFVRESLAEMPEGDVAGHRRVRARLARGAPAVRARGDRRASRPRRSRTRPTSAPRSGWPGRCSPTTPRSGSCCSPTATTPRAPARPRRRWPRRAGIQVQTHLIGLDGRDEVLVERLVAPSTARLGEEVEVTAEVRTDGRPDLDGPPVRRRLAGRQRRRSSWRPASTG